MEVKMNGYLMPIIVGLVVGGCDALGIGGSEDHGRLQASISGAVSVEYEGTGTFRQGDDPRIGVPSTMTIRSEGIGEYSGQRVIIYGFVGIGDEGPFELGLLNYDEPDAGQFTAMYLRDLVDMYEAYVAESGHIEISESSQSRLAGTFSFVARRYCLTPKTNGEPPVGSCTPELVDADAPSIAVSGTFETVPRTHGEVVDLRRQL
jgi:hypothetical protein